MRDGDRSGHLGDPEAAPRPTPPEGSRFGWDPASIEGLSFPDWLRTPPPQLSAVSVLEARVETAGHPVVGRDLRVTCLPYRAHDGGPWLVDVIHEALFYARVGEPVPVQAAGLEVAVEGDGRPLDQFHGIEARAGSRVVLQDSSGWYRGFRAVSFPQQVEGSHDLCVAVVDEVDWYLRPDLVPTWWPTFCVWVQQI